MTQSNTRELSPQARAVVRRFLAGDVSGDEARAELGMPAVPRGPQGHSDAQAA